MQANNRGIVFLVAAILGTSIIAWSQQQSAATTGDVTKSARAFAYQVGGGSTRIDFKGTELMPRAEGEAKVQAKQGATEIEAKVKNLSPATTFGAEFLTYVLWAVSTEGRTDNLGEVQLNKNGDGKLKVSTQMQVFSLILTAEPYFAVRVPSELVILENEMRKNTKARMFPVEAYTLMERGRYQKLGNPLAMSLDLKNVPLEMYQARNAVEIAKTNGAEKYASEVFSRADASLQMAEKAVAVKASKKIIISTARQAIQFSEDARILAVQRQEEEALANERKAAEEAEQRARDQAEQEALRRSQAEAATARAEAAAAQAAAEQAKAEAARARALLEQEQARREAAEEARLRAAAEAEKKRALTSEERARVAAAEAERRRIAAEKEKAELRAMLFKQFSLVLDTRDTERGLVVNMSDVLFDTGKYNLRPQAREKLARISGIVLIYPGLRLEAEGHTDNTGGADLNQKLSEQRADAVRQYLVSQGISEDAITSVGKGFSMPVESNDTAAGRQKNRRVELIVSGEVIGTSVGKIRP